MATIRIDTVRCIRQQDISGEDEPILEIAGLKVWGGKMDNDESVNLNVSRPFNNSVVVELKEQNPSGAKSLGKWTVTSQPTPNGNPPLTATSSGYHYEVYFDVLK